MNKVAIIIISVILAMALGLSGCVTAKPEPETELPSKPYPIILTGYEVIELISKPVVYPVTITGPGYELNELISKPPVWFTIEPSEESQ